MTTKATRRRRSPEQEASRIAAAFESYPRRGARWQIAGGSEATFGVARVCRAWPTRALHVIGTSEVAERLRAIYGADKVTGWTLHPMPDTRTPLDTLRQKLIELGGGSGRVYTALDRAGFALVEEVSACPDAELRDIRTIGTTTLAIVRAVMPYVGPDINNKLAPAGRHQLRSPAGKAELTAAFSPITQARYRRLVDGLLASAIPADTVGKIATSLNTEHTPPADPLVEALLETVGSAGLLQLYRETHPPSSEPPPDSCQPHQASGG
ncbi:MULTISPECIES: hypothetical protein [unclassified Amycolatopsis]|uniref:hypothetical protein n=1 Tax=unclassified Amycolatopsis TaxID=2618356 RepID=UPI002874591D|nr:MULTISPECIES: hypothetical protein [unclassified Amycolatopsis]MDS0140550.1 hypothetical protein [Amycolatopsis sp. 505]MDS0149200.1 hypothetical protein [Amycolatopsis sp. CM201R]